MKNTILSFVFLLLASLAFGQSEKSPAQQMTDRLTEKYGLTPDQQAKMLTIQERNFRQLAEIEDLKKSNPTLYIQKMRALKMGMDGSVKRILREDQLAIFRQEKIAFRKQKSTIYSEMKSKGATQQQIDMRLCQLEEAALRGQ